jgi:hypothetical protein
MEENEYRKSLEEHAHMESKYSGFVKQWSQGKIIPEEELLVFLNELKDRWPLMFALEQRQHFREWARYICTWIDGWYRDSNRRHSAMGGSEYVGIFGEVRPARDGVHNLLDEEIHRGQQVFDLNMLESMASAVDKRSQTGR